jgi:hypothetical protein
MSEDDFDGGAEAGAMCGILRAKLAAAERERDLALDAARVAERDAQAWQAGVQIAVAALSRMESARDAAQAALAEMTGHAEAMHAQRLRLSRGEDAELVCVDCGERKGDPCPRGCAFGDFRAAHPGKP